LKSGQTAGSANLYSTSVAIGRDGRGYAAGQASNGQVTFEPNTFNALSSGEYYIIRFGDLPSNGLAINIQNNTGTDTVVCGGYIALQGVVTPSNLASTAKYYWYADNDTMTFTFPAATLNATPKVNSTYIVTAYAGGCVASDTISLYVQPLPFTAGLDTTICFGTSIPLTATTYASAHYHWVPALGLDNDTIQNPVLTGISSSQYIAEMNAGGCVSRDTFDIFVNALPLADFNYIANFLSVDFVDVSTGALSNTWDFGDGNTAVQLQSVQHVYTNTGTYTACLYIENDCGTDTICKTFTITNVGINEAENSNDVFISEDALNYNISSTSKLKGVEVVAISGAIQLKSSPEQFGYTIQKSSLATGIYLVRITTERGIVNKKLQVVR
jgi:PKD repeat protein